MRIVFLMPASMTFQEIQDKITDKSHLKVELSNRDPLDSYLEYLQTDETPFLYQDSQLGNGSFSCRIASQVHQLKLGIAKDIIHEKYGAIGQRLWSILSSQGKLEEKQVNYLVFDLKFWLVSCAWHPPRMSEKHCIVC